jgi:hypothetical protein
VYKCLKDTQGPWFHVTLDSKSAIALQSVGTILVGRHVDPAGIENNIKLYNCFPERVSARNDIYEVKRMVTKVILSRRPVPLTTLLRKKLAKNVNICICPCLYLLLYGGNILFLVIQVLHLCHMLRPALLPAHA